MNIILLGPPGAGKGTQAAYITKSYNLFKVSSGDLLRAEVEKKTDLGNTIKSIINKGAFVSDDIINNLITNILSNKKYYNRLIFDGYPRNLNQAKSLNTLMEKYNEKISFVLSLNVDKESLLKRILGRQTCAKCGQIFNQYFKQSSKVNHTCGNEYLIKRQDDNEKTIIHRYKTYLEKTFPILEYYKKLSLLHEINGNIEIDQIFKQITRIIAPLET